MTFYSLHQKKPAGTGLWNSGVTFGSDLPAVEEKPHSGMTAIIILPPKPVPFSHTPNFWRARRQTKYQLWWTMRKEASKEAKRKSTKDLKHGLCSLSPSRLHTRSTVLLMHKKAKLTVRKKKITNLSLSLKYTENRSESLQQILAMKWPLSQLFHRACLRSMRLTKGPSAWRPQIKRLAE